MSIHFACPSCGRPFTVSEEKAGQKGKCPCGEAIRVPDAKHAEAAAPVAAPRSAGAARPPQTAAPPPEPELAAGPVSSSPATPWDRGGEPAAGPTGPVPAAPGYGRETRHQVRPNRPLGLTLVCLIGFLFTAGVAVLGVLTLLASGGVAAGLTRKIGAPVSVGKPLAVGAGLLVGALIVGGLYSALWQGRFWARTLFTVLNAFSLFRSLLLLFGSQVPTAYALGGLVASALIIWALNTRSARAFCS